MKLKYKFVATQIGGKNVAVPTGEGTENLNCVFQLNDTAYEILKCLEKDTNVDEIVAHMLKVYDSTEEHLAVSINKFLSQLREQNLLIE